MQVLCVLLLAIGLIGALVSLLILGLAALAALGVLADAGPAENRRMAVQLLSWGLPSLIGGLALSALGILGFVWSRRRIVPGVDGRQPGRK